MAKMGSKDKMPTAGIPGGRGRKAPKAAPAGSKQAVGSRGKATGGKAPNKDSKLGMGTGKTYGRC
jgi:hypothetical protein